MPILTCIFFTFNWLTLTSEIHFVKFHPDIASCLLSQRQKKVCTPGDEAIMKIHKKLFSVIPINFIFSVISPKLQRVWSWNFGFATRKIWAFIWYIKKCTTSGWALGDENVIGIRAFNRQFEHTVLYVNNFYTWNYVMLSDFPFFGGTLRGWLPPPPLHPLDATHAILTLP